MHTSTVFLLKSLRTKLVRILRRHFVSTSHTFSLQVGTQRVWDYAGDNYVHRLVAGKEDGKLVEVEGRTADKDGTGGAGTGGGGGGRNQDSVSW